MEKGEQVMSRSISLFMSGVAGVVLVLAAPALLDASAIAAQGKRIEHSKIVKHAHRMNRTSFEECLYMPWRRACNAFGFVGPATGPGIGPGVGEFGSSGSGAGGGFGSGPGVGGGFGSGPGGGFGSVGGQGSGVAAGPGPS